MDERTRDPIAIRAEDVNPRYNWGRALPALGIMGVDFEERVDYRRLHRYRLARVRRQQQHELPGFAESGALRFAEARRADQKRGPPFDGDREKRHRCRCRAVVDDHV